MAIQYEHENPIITDTPIHSNAEGLEAIAKTMGAVAHEAFKDAGDIGEQRSNAMYAQSQAQLDSLKTKAKIQMIQHPGDASKIAESVTKNYDQILQEAVVNKSDRGKLKMSAAKDYNDISLDAARTQIGVDRKAAYVGFATQWPDVLKNIKESVGDEKEFNNRLDSAHKLLSTMLVNEVISPYQADGYFKMLHHTIDASRAYLNAVNDRNIDAKGYHQVKGGLIPVDDGTHMNQPVDQNTQHLYQAHNNDTTLQTLKSSIANGEPGNPEAWTNLGEKELPYMAAYAHGSASVKAHVISGSPISELQQDLKRYEKMGTLSAEESGREAAIKHLLSDKGLNAFNDVLAQNPIYRSAEFQYNQNMAAIQNNPNLSPQQRADLARTYDNQLTWQKVSLAESMHVPDAMVKPLAPSFVEPTKTVWGVDADVSPMLTHVDYVQKGLKEYVAREQKTPVQQEVTRIVGAATPGTMTSIGSWAGSLFGHQERITDSDRADLIRANQMNRNFGDLKLGERDNSDEKIRKDVALNLSGALGFLPSQPEGATRSVALVTAATNLVKYYAQQSGDLEMQHKQHYISKATSIINAAYPIQSGSNWRINQNDIDADKVSLDKVSNYVINDAKSQLLAHYGNNRAALEADLSSNSLSAVSTPTGHIAVVDAYGSEIYRTKYRSSLVHYADHVMSKEPEVAEKVASIPERDTNVSRETFDQDEKAISEARSRGKKQNAKLKKAMEKAKEETTH